ncbi:hypothetical protein ABQE42_11895, partial [Mycolicibacterium pulveris]
QAAQQFRLGTSVPLEELHNGNQPTFHRLFHKAIAVAFLRYETRMAAGSTRATLGCHIAVG